ncbi:tRNA pseudouridine(55) synthase TruB [Parvularcula sp. ZS-1/3]|uniref:tRNA pseudouridine synthase B n=1 Tax=Parvularcula mediterranea TaxID=2732508 RepID=A0A7Y3RKP6_9PROT|nr:tRNA pseudouridine(55) synthase TruB [Parvularcula mediterranea]NNU15775.1 tRNA pseudouridine(55) synthase TruB [Parvularcula mediterranea]
MARRKKGRKVHGWLILDKGYDVGSTEAVSRMRWFADAQKAGHAGTLDPLATGILPIAFGEATKTVPFVQDGLKTYRFTARWGVRTTTDDLEGEVAEESDVRPDRAAIEAILPDFTGTIEQVPPQFSAILVNGERAYDLARDGEEVKLKPREVDIEDLRLVEMPDADHAVFEAVVGKGTYVRALVRDMAEKLGTVAHVSALRRTAVGPFTEDQAITAEEVTGVADDVRLTPEQRDHERFDGCLVPIGEAMAEYPKEKVAPFEASRLRSGQGIVLTPNRAKVLRAGHSGELETVLAESDEGEVALCRLDGLTLAPQKVFQLG